MTSFSALGKMSSLQMIPLYIPHLRSTFHQSDSLNVLIITIINFHSERASQRELESSFIPVLGRLLNIVMGHIKG